MRSVVLVVLLLVAGCAAAAQDPPGTDTVATTIPTTTTTALVTTTAAVVSTLPEVSPGPSFVADPASTRGLVTESGVLVAVTDEMPQGFLVSTPCGNEELVETGTRVGEVTVVLDPGHGGEIDTGAVGANGLMEKNLNLEVAQAVEAKLILRGITVALTRNADYASTLSARAALADRLSAEILVSIHHNAPTPGPSNIPGTEVFIQHDSEESRRLGGLVWEHTVDALAGFDIQWAGANDAGVLVVLSTRGEDAYGMNRNPETVSVLAELGYISHPTEAALFATSQYVNRAAGALADAIESYLTTDDLGSGFVDEPRVFNPQPGLRSGACDDPALR